MKPELEQQLQDTSKEYLLLLLKELAMRHPVLLTEMVSILESLSGTDSGLEDIDEEVTEDWDFSGDELGTLRTLPQRVQLNNPLDANSEAHNQRVEEYAARLSAEKLPQAIAECLTDLVEEAVLRIGHHDYQGALDLFAFLLDERLLERIPEVMPIFDEYVDAAMYSLEELLSEASSNTTFDATNVTLSPLLTNAVRHRWLERLFALWLKRLDAHRVEEDLPEIMLDVAWNEDMALLRNLVQNELPKQSRNEHTNIVDFTRQYRSRALEKFLKELPRS